MFASFMIFGCSTQPLTVNQELTVAAVAGAIGAGAGAVFAAATHEAYPPAIGIGAGGFAGIVLLYEEITREAALQNMPPPPPISPGPPSPSSQNP
jgi:hypothetical protein